MSSKAEIEAQIAALQVRLHEHLTYDPAFTPAELVRWDPSLVGTVLHIQHELDIPANAFEQLVTYKDYKSYVSKGGYKYEMQFENPSNVYIPSREWMMKHRGNITAPTPGYVNQDRINNIGILGATGIKYMNFVIPTADNISSSESRGRIEQIEINDFNQFTFYQALVNHPLQMRTIAMDEYPVGDISFQLIGGKIIKKTYTVNGKGHNDKSLYNSMMYQLPLANPSRPPLDQIYIAIHNRLPTYTYIDPSEPLVTVDKYPLSTLYQEWKRDKAAG